MSISERVPQKKIALVRAKLSTISIPFFALFVHLVYNAFTMLVAYLIQPVDKSLEGLKFNQAKNLAGFLFGKAAFCFNKINITH